MVGNQTLGYFFVGQLLNIDACSTPPQSGIQVKKDNLLISCQNIRDNRLEVKDVILTIAATRPLSIADNIGERGAK